MSGFSDEVDRIARVIWEPFRMIHGPSFDELPEASQECHRDAARAALSAAAGVGEPEREGNYLALSDAMPRLREQRDTAVALLGEAATHLRNIPAMSEQKDRAMWEKIEAFVESLDGPDEPAKGEAEPDPEPYTVEPHLIENDGLRDRIAEALWDQWWSNLQTKPVPVPWVLASFKYADAVLSVLHEAGTQDRGQTAINLLRQLQRCDNLDAISHSLNTTVRDFLNDEPATEAGTQEDEELALSLPDRVDHVVVDGADINVIETR